MARNVGKHGIACTRCGRKTYRSSHVCSVCDPVDWAKRIAAKTPYIACPDPKVWPEDYLLKCAQELLRRHNERHALLMQLGIKTEAA